MKQSKASKSKVVSLLDRLERWTVVYVSPDGNLKVKASNHGRVSFHLKGQTPEEVTRLEFVESVSMLSNLSDGMSYALEAM